MSDPFKIEGPTCISFSGGRTSAYMLWRVLQSNNGLPEEARVLFCNTGKEMEETLSFVDRCGKEWGVPITWLEYRAAEPKFEIVDHETASRDGKPFSELVIKRSYLPNPIARFCTSELKVLTIQRYLKSVGMDDYDTMLGIRADEKRRVAKLREGNLTPLVNANVSQPDVQAFWRSQNFDLGLEHRNGITAWGNCDLCFLKGPNQILGLIRDQPERAIWWAKQEEAIGGTFRSDRPSYAEMANFAKNQMDMFADDEGIPCFCGD
jgi:3'-phosphoadenosine 5'-phosphosulfate sulfotransferase (PAPS reductase)/FAD synthetase